MGLTLSVIMNMISIFHNMLLIYFQGIYILEKIPQYKDGMLPEGEQRVEVELSIIDVDSPTTASQPIPFFFIRGSSEFVFAFLFDLVMQ